MGGKRGPGPIGDLIGEVLGDFGLDEASVGVRLLEVWEEALGPELAPFCRPEGIRNEILYARVPDSAWMQRLQLETPDILERLREHLGDATPCQL